MSNRYTIKMILGGVGAFVAFALDGRLSADRAGGQQVKESEAQVFEKPEIPPYPTQTVFLLTDGP
ncbi:MAG: hypothetical protein JO170_07435 [Verrucomicrobia bacterium]|nr:hypothetical protein [Verrucomicrobiota bacterium]